MTRPSPLWLVLALGGLACAPKAETFGLPDSGETISTSSSTSSSSASGGGGAGGGTASGGTTTSGGMTASGGTTQSGGAGGTGGAGGATGPCMEDPATIPAEGHYFTPPPSNCRCKEEAAELLPIIAQAAKDHHDTHSNVGCGSSDPVPQMIPAKTYYVPYSTGLGLDFDTGTATTGWLCLGVPTPEIIHCRYRFTKGSNPVSQPLGAPPINDAEGFEISAQGDTDGDGVLATFAILGSINANNELVLVPMYENNPEE